ncbi:eIF-2-alpha kinase GCN2-like [Ornithodoros turicata]|uniref:eIF-2-alpha kinase GCN2-like n=1 Tax=Ornithodoros turicata TaxID=34597 RepID=UPI003138CB0F
MEREELKERQQNELAVLQSIFLGDVKDLRKRDKCKIWRPLEISLTLRPQESMTRLREVHVQVDLHVTCSVRYPYEAPKLSLCNPKGLSKDAILKIEKELSELSEQLKGEVMILELAQHVQKCLHDYNTPRFSSFYDEMLNNREQQEKAKAAAQEAQMSLERLEEERRRQALEQEIERRQEEIKVEEAARRSSSQGGSCNHGPPEILAFAGRTGTKHVQRGACLGHSSRGCVVFAGLDLTSGAPMCVLEWTPMTAENAATIERELQSLLLRLCHSTLLHYLGCLFVPEKRALYLLQEFAGGCSLRSYVARSITIDGALLRSYLQGTLQALAYLHQHSVVHKDLRDSDVFIDSCGGVRLANYSLSCKLAALCQGSKEPSSGVRAKKKKGDVYQLGLLVLVLVRGQKEGLVDIPSTLSVDLQDFLRCCLCARDADRWSCDQLLSHPFVMGTTSIPANIDDAGDTGPPALLNHAASTHSRLQAEFETLEWLGRGGFGDVFKVRNRLDGCIYALKRILLNRSSRLLDKKIMREVKLLSRLNHENIVRYYHSWIEVTTEAPNEDSPSASRDWSIHKPKSEHPFGSMCISSSDDDDDDVVVFEGSREEEDASGDEAPVTVRSYHFMFIQMEFCEKSTLRTAIDTGLSNNVTRVWRLFREIVEGLAHIHQQGMIHRDLKPVNIFLDSSDRVKIGDFGLATTALVPRGEANELALGDISNPSSLTGRVGTALYTAPELLQTGTVIYSQKVDIYSLGIILFEMCYPAMRTAMERVQLLAKLRQPEVELPTGKRLTSQQSHLVRWLLQHDPAKRPSSKQLLAELPPPRLEEAQLHDALCHTVANPRSRAYKLMVEALFRQQASPVQDHTYDSELGMAPTSTALAFQHVEGVLVEVLKRHGALPLSVPTLLPRNGQSEVSDSVLLLDPGGLVVSLPHDLRTPFARYVARRDVAFLKRYTIEKVYRPRRVQGCHPRELYECAFDVVAPGPCTCLFEAETLQLVAEIVNEFPELQNRGYVVRLGHTALLSSLLIHCGVAEEHWAVVRTTLYEARRGDSRLQLQQRLSTLAVPESAATMLAQFHELEDVLPRVASAFRFVARQRGPAAALARQALHELEALLELAAAMGLTLPVVVAPCLVAPRNIYTGPVFEVACSSRRAQKAARDVLAIGGRYDALVASFAMGGRRDVRAVGISIAVEKIVQALCEGSPDDLPGAADCALGIAGEVPPVVQRDQATLLGALWTAKARVLLLPPPEALVADDPGILCRERRIPYLALMRDGEPGVVRLRCTDRDRTERKVLADDLCELVARTSKTSDLPQPQRGPESGPRLEAAALRISLLLADRSLSGARRRRHEAQIATQLRGLGATLAAASKPPLDVLACDLDGQLLRSTIAYLDVEGGPEPYHSSIATLLDRHPRHRKYLARLADEVHDLVFQSGRTVLVLYALHDNTYKVMVFPSRT